MRPHYHSGHESAKAKSKGFIPSTPTGFIYSANASASNSRSLRLIWPADTISYGPPYPYKLRDLHSPMKQKLGRRKAKDAFVAFEADVFAAYELTALARRKAQYLKVEAEAGAGASSGTGFAQAA